MNVSIKDVTAVKKELNVTVSQEELAPYFDKAIKKYQKTAKVPGFRQGHVPLQMIVKMYGTAIQYQEIEKIAQEFYLKAFSEKKLEPVARPAMRDLQYQPGSDLTFVVAYDVKPEVKLPAIKKLNLQKINPDLQEEDLNLEIEYLLKMSSKVVNDYTGPLGEDDFAVLKVEELDENGNQTGKTLNNKIFSKRSQEFSEKDQALLLGKNAGDSAKLTIQEDGKDRKILATIQSITTFAKPDFTDEFVKEYTGGKFETADAFREELKSGLAKRLLRQSENSLQDSIMDELVAESELELPESLVEAYLDSMVHEESHKGKNHEAPKDFNEAEFRVKNRKLAERSAKWWLVKQELVEKEKFEVTEDDFNAYLTKVSAEDNIPVATLKQVYSKPENKGTIENMIQTQKLVDWVAGQSKVKVVKPAEFKLKAE